MTNRRRIDDMHFGVIEGIDIDAMIREDPTGTDDEWFAALCIFGVMRPEEAWPEEFPATPPGIRLLGAPLAKDHDAGGG